MKSFLIILSCFFISCTGRRRKQIPLFNVDTTYYEIHDTFKLNVDYPGIDSMIVRTDTVKDPIDLTTRDYDSADRIIRITTRSKSGQDDVATDIYDTAGNEIYEEHVSGNIRWHAYRSTYDILGHMIHKEGYGSGDIGSKVTYVYHGNRIVQITSEKPGSMRTIRFGSDVD